MDNVNNITPFSYVDRLQVYSSAKEKGTNALLAILCSLLVSVRSLEFAVFLLIILLLISSLSFSDEYTILSAFALRMMRKKNYHYQGFFFDKVGNSENMYICVNSRLYRYKVKRNSRGRKKKTLMIHNDAIIFFYFHEVLGFKGADKFDK